MIISVNFMLVMASADPSLLEAPTGDAAREIGPGFAGFVATALMVVAVIFLIRDMVRRIRRVRYQGEAEQRQSDLVERGRQYGQDDEDETGSGSAGTRGQGTGDAGTDDAGHGGGQTPRT
ncbi:hypothetical protein [Zhihengliuella salsuginis]|uniref:hypothetical protein n=1 Tax=Zhihengliuella salsuginis TaxID=578222 RepID=UPI001674F386|nr:hypothetical protein [Zhihengliuella salsuginis]